MGRREVFTKRVHSCERDFPFPYLAYQSHSDVNQVVTVFVNGTPFSRSDAARCALSFRLARIPDRDCAASALHSPAA
jgi:hypothetical protein